MSLRPHQIKPARHLIEILKTQQVAMDWSEMGVGKTAVGVAVAKELGLPTLIVTPFIAQTAWANMAALFGDKFSIINYEMLRTGNTPFGKWQYARGITQNIFVCTNCQRKFKPDETPDACYCRPDGVHCYETKKMPHRHGRFNFHPGIQFIVFDEIHRCGGLNSLNSELVIAARRQGIKHLGLSATPASSPLDFRALGFALGLHNLTDFYNWLFKHGYRKLPVGGLEWMVSRQRQIEIMAEIRAQIIPAQGVRVTTDSIPDFPDVDIQAELYDIENAANINSIYEEMGTALAQLKSHGEGDKNADHPLTKILRARQRIELLKVPLMVELCQDYRAKGFSVALFVNFRQTIEELSKRLKTDCIIDGSSNGKKYRQMNLDRFQNNSAREIILNNEAGKESLSLHDTDGNFPRIGLAMPVFSAETARQLLGRLPRHGGKSKSHYRFIFAANTIEARMRKVLALRLNNMDALTDADFQPNNLELT